MTSSRASTRTPSTSCSSALWTCPRVLSPKAALLKLATRLKDPAPSTQVEWMRHLTTFLELVKVDDVSDVTKDDAQQYRDISSTPALPVQPRLDSDMSGDVRGCSGRRWLDENPFAGITNASAKRKSRSKFFRLLSRSSYRQAQSN